MDSSSHKNNPIPQSFSQPDFYAKVPYQPDMAYNSASNLLAVQTSASEQHNSRPQSNSSYQKSLYPNTIENQYPQADNHIPQYVATPKYDSHSSGDNMHFQNSQGLSDHRNNYSNALMPQNPAAPTAANVPGIQNTFSTAQFYQAATYNQNSSPSINPQPNQQMSSLPPYADPTQIHSQQSNMYPHSVTSLSSSQYTQSNRLIDSANSASSGNNVPSHLPYANLPSVSNSGQIPLTPQSTFQNQKAQLPPSQNVYSNDMFRPQMANTQSRSFYSGNSHNIVPSIPQITNAPYSAPLSNASPMINSAPANSQFHPPFVNQGYPRPANPGLSNQAQIKPPQAASFQPPQINSQLTPSYTQAPVPSMYPVHTYGANAAFNGNKNMNTNLPAASQTPQSLTNALNSLNLQQSPVQQSYIDLLHEKYIYPTQELPLLKPTVNIKTSTCDPEILSCTLNCIPNTNALLQKSRLPLGLILQPFKEFEDLRIIQSSVIVRCRSCRTYINPFVIFLDPSRWKCNICFKVNDLPSDFCYDQALKTYIEPHKKSEMRFATVEHIAPSDYMLRPPQPAIYVFVLDVSFNAMETGYLDIFCDVLLSELDHLKGDTRTRVGFIAFDSAIRFFNLSEDLAQPQILVCSDLEEVYLPCPDGLLVNLSNCRSQVVLLLQQLVEMHRNNEETQSALGSALEAAYKLVSSTGGRITVVQTHLPTIGSGQLKNREDPNERIGQGIGGMNPVTDFYKKFALECSAQQIAVDLFFLSSQYSDISTITCAAKYSGGSVFYFPGFHATANLVETIRFVNQLRRYFTRSIGFEAVMRVRCTKGISISTFHGNSFVRSTDLLALPNTNPDAGYALHLFLDDTVESNFACFQAALLYTSTNAERRIRVHTLCIPVTSNQADLYTHANQQCIIALLARMAVDKAISHSMVDARDALVNSAVDIVGAYMNTLSQTQRTGHVYCSNTLSLVPLYVLALLKSTAFRTSVSTKLDERVFALELLKNTPIKQLLLEIHPHLYPIHIWDEKFLVDSKVEGVKLPPLLSLSSMQVDKFGAYLLDTGRYLLIFLSLGIREEFLRGVFGVGSLGELIEGEIDLPLLDNDISKNIREFIEIRNDLKPHPTPTVLIKSDGKMRSWFQSYLIEDRTESTFSYLEFLQHIQKEIKM